MKYKKGYSEIYAFLSLVYFYDKQLKCLSLSDKPDLQSESLDIGIEVTESISKKYGNERFHINQIFGQKLSANEVLILSKRVKAINGKVRIIAGFATYSHHSGLFDTSTIFEKIRESIHLKSDKLNKNYRIFKDNWLYIFTNTSLIEKNDLQTVFDYWPITYLNRNFSQLFVNCIDRIFVIEQNGIIFQILLTDLDLKDLKMKSIEFDGCIQIL